MDKICKECGCVIENDEYIVTRDGDYVCENCRDDYFLCEECGEWYHIDYAICVDGYTYVCEECADNNYYRCNECGDYVSRDYVYFNRNGDPVCEGCISRYYVYCEECGEYVYEDEYDYDSEMCYSCAENNIIKPYHWHKDDDPLFYISADRSTWTPRDEWFMGIEWELETSASEHDARALHDILGDRAYFERDCSINGFETIFQPHTYEAILESDAIREAFEYANDCMTANSHTGLHIHVSRTAFGSTEEEQEDNIAKIVALHTKGHAFNTLAKLARREDFYYCSAVHHDRKAKESAKEYVDGHGGHGVALNCCNRNTVEFRLGQSTTDYDEFIAWVKIVKMLVDACKKIDFEDANNFYMWFADADDDIKAYMMENGVIWEAPIEVNTGTYRKVISRLCAKINENLDAQNMDTIDENVMLALVAGASMQTRVSLGYYD